MHVGYLKIDMKPFCWCLELERQSGERPKTVTRSNPYEWCWLCLVSAENHGTPYRCTFFLKPVKTGCWATIGVLYLKNKCLNLIEVYSNTQITNSFCHDACLLYWWIFYNICIFDLLIYIGSYCTGCFICCRGDYYRIISIEK